MRGTFRFLALAPLLFIAKISLALGRAPSAAELEAARQAFAEGLALEVEGQWATALERFDRAAAVRASPAVSFHRGLCLEHIGRLVDGLDAFLRVERDATGDANASHVATLATQHVTRIRQRLPVLILHPPAAALVRVDGVEVRAFEMPLPVDPGAHRIVVESPAHAPATRVVTALEAERVDVHLAVGPPAVAAPAPAPAAARPGGSAVPFVLGGVALGAFVTAGVFYGMRQSAIDELEAGCNGPSDCPSSLQSVHDRGVTATIAANVALGVGIGASTAAVVTQLLLRPTPSRAVALELRGSVLLLRGVF